MACHHRHTFLRSAIARDPFCHGGIITPEDVLRLEAKFPTLFDKPALPPTPTPEKNDVGSGDEDDRGKAAQAHPGQDAKKKVTTRINPLKSILAKKPIAHAGGKVSTGVTKTQGSVRTPTAKQGTTTGQKKVTSEFHKKCVENAPVAAGQSKTGPVRIATVKPAISRVQGTGSSKLTRPAQSFSLEDLRATLRQVMEEDALQKNKWLRSDNSPSPYTEDLVKKFLGWKMRQRAEQRQKAANANTRSRFMGQGDAATARMKALTATMAAYHENSPMYQNERSRLTTHSTAIQSPSKISREKAIPRVRSAPGFLRGHPELPPVPNYQKKRMMLSMAKREGAAVVNSPRKPTREEAEGNVGTGHHGGGGGDGESRGKHVRWEEYDEEDVEWVEEEGGKLDKHRSRVRNQSSEQSLRKNVTGQAEIRKPKRPGMRGTQIHLRSQKTPEMETAEAHFANDDRYKVKSSYKDLLAARSEKTRYEVKGFLRKQEVPCNFYNKQLEREKKERKTLRAKLGAHFTEPESSSDPSDNFVRKMRQLGDRSKEETNQVLEIMAKELVYMEVLHQINELKREQEDAELDERKKELRKPSSSTSSSPRQPPNKISQMDLPKFVPTTSDQDTSESGDRRGKNGGGSKSDAEIILKTPELTPPSGTAAAKKRPTEKKKTGNEEKVDVISLHTPELSPSPRRLIAAIRERKELEKKLREASPPHQQLDTDCSEMSDFVFSEPSRKEEIAKKNSRKNASVQEEESVKLETPQLSASHQDSRQLDVEHQGPETPEKDASTFSNVPSAFLETPSASHAKNPEVEESMHSDREKSSAKYSDDFTPEKASEKKESMKSDTAPPLQSPAIDDDYKSDVDPNDNPLNTSGETVIDLLSEGEFLGNSYRSPGELSWRQQRNAPPPRPLPTFSNISAATSSSNRKQGVARSLSFASTTIEGADNNNDDNDEDEESISILSYGARIAPGSGESAGKSQSMGEYLRT